MIDHLWQSTLFALVIAALVPLFRRQGAGLRFWLWFAASVKFLIPLSLLVRLGGYLPALPAKALIAPTTFAAPDLIAPPAHVLPTTEIFVAVWALGALLMAGLWLMRWRNLNAVMRDADTLDLPAPSVVPVKLVASFVEPGLVGIWRPVILMPRGIAERLSPCEMQAVLAHELSHHRRRDNLLALAQMLVEMLFWFHPLVWWISARLVAERERACDEAVLETGNAPRAYAQGILKICRFHLQPGLACTAGVSGGDLKVRVHAIMTDQGREALDGSRILLLGGLGLATVMLPLLAGAPGTTPMNRLARQMASVLTAPALPRMEFSAPAAAPVAQPRRVAAAPVLVAPVAAGPVAEAPVAPAAEPAPESSGSVIVTHVKPFDLPLDDTVICRRPQPLSGSRLRGPQVCLSASAWAELAAQGKDVSPDGRNYVASAIVFEKANSTNPPSCLRMGAGSATTAMAGLARAVCF